MRKSKVEKEMIRLMKLIASKQLDKATEKIETVQLRMEGYARGYCCGQRTGSIS